MRRYLAKRREEQPEAEIWSRAKKRAISLGLPFTITPDDVRIPSFCPALGIPLHRGRGRSRNSPSLDRVEPSLGYIAENIRVISDHANRLKSNHDLVALRGKAQSGNEAFRGDYSLIVRYLERELCLANLRETMARCEDAMEMLDRTRALLDG